jgi:hypothetical protein
MAAKGLGNGELPGGAKEAGSTKSWLESGFWNVESGVWNLDCSPAVIGFYDAKPLLPHLNTCLFNSTCRKFCENSLTAS